jgi:hypothetical protein
MIVRRSGGASARVSTEREKCEESDTGHSCRPPVDLPPRMAPDFKLGFPLNDAAPNLVPAELLAMQSIWLSGSLAVGS